jgi:hypothetical protein
VGKKADSLSQLNQAFSPAVISSRLGTVSFGEIDSLGFLFLPNMNQHDALMSAAACQISTIRYGHSNTLP